MDTKMHIIIFCSDKSSPHSQSIRKLSAQWLIWDQTDRWHGNKKAPTALKAQLGQNTPTTHMHVCMCVLMSRHVIIHLLHARARAHTHTHTHFLQLSWGKSNTNTSGNSHTIYKDKNLNYNQLPWREWTDMKCVLYFGEQRLRRSKVGWYRRKSNVQGG